MLEFNKGRISSISVCLPEKKVCLKEVARSIPIDKREAEKIIKTTGFTHIRESEKETALDLCVKAGKKLLSRMDDERIDQIDAIIFVSQTRDYILPQGANIIQNQLGLKNSIICIDLPLGCSGYVYGLIQSLSLINSGLKNVLLFAGETNSKFVSRHDKTTKMVFGDAGTASLIENRGIEDTKIIFDFGSDGSGFGNIIINSGGSRNPITSKSLIDTNTEPGIQRNDSHILMKGLEVMNFAIDRVPKSIENCISKTDKSLVEKYYLHQANKFMINYIGKKSKIEKDKLPFNSTEIGNTGPASIPTAIAHDILINGNPGVSILSGFGVGLSWATCLMNLKTLEEIKIISYEN